MEGFDIDFDAFQQPYMLSQNEMRNVQADYHLKKELGLPIDLVEKGKLQITMLAFAMKKAEPISRLQLDYEVK